MSNHEPGTVAVATVRGVPNVRVFRGEGFWRTAVEVGGNVTHHDFNDGVADDIRPLIVLDLDGYDRERAVTYLRNLARESRDVFDKSPSPRGKLANLIADQIEQQTKPPRIPEPGLLGVVKAHIGAGGPWTLTRSEYGWVCLDDGTLHDWDSLIDPVLVRPGIEDGAS
jgi:hypothetical protein